MVAGLGASLVLHVVTLMALGRVPLAPPAEPSELIPIEVAVMSEEAVRLGIEESAADTPNWLGFEEPTEHRAEESTTDQPALAINSGAPGESAPAPEALPSPEAEEPPEAPEPAEPAEAIAAAPSDPAAGSPTPRTPDQLSPDIAAMLETLQPLAEQLARAATEIRAQLSRPRPAAPASAGDPGERSDRDSVATAMEGSIDVVPGRPAAGKGLTIKTVRPRWRHTTLMTSWPDNPVVIIRFLRNGTVYEADFEAGKGTGYAAVDGPLLDAVYAWKAEGAALDRLPPGEDATLEVRINMILR